MIIDIAPTTAYVVKFPGYLNKTHVIELQQKLHDDLMHDGVEFDRTVVLAGEYTKFPITHDRHNDLIYMGKPKGNDNLWNIWRRSSTKNGPKVMVKE